MFAFVPQSPPSDLAPVAYCHVVTYPFPFSSTARCTHIQDTQMTEPPDVTTM